MSAARVERNLALKSASPIMRGLYTTGVKGELSRTTKPDGSPAGVVSRLSSRRARTASRHPGAGFNHVTSKCFASRVRIWWRDFQLLPHWSKAREITPMSRDGTLTSWSEWDKGDSDLLSIHQLSPSHPFAGATLTRMCPGQRGAAHELRRVPTPFASVRQQATKSS